MKSNSFKIIMILLLAACSWQAAQAQSMQEQQREAAINDSLILVEPDAYQTALSANTRSAFSHYLSDYTATNSRGKMVYKPIANKLHVLDIARRLKDMDLWDAACKANTIDAYNIYMQNSKVHAYNQQAKDAIAKLSAQNASTLAAAGNNSASNQVVDTDNDLDLSAMSSSSASTSTPAPSSSDVVTMSTTAYSTLNAQLNKMQEENKDLQAKNTSLNDELSQLKAKQAGIQVQSSSTPTQTVEKHGDDVTIPYATFQELIAQQDEIRNWQTKYVELKKQTDAERESTQQQLSDLRSQLNGNEPVSNEHPAAPAPSQPAASAQPTMSAQPAATSEHTVDIENRLIGIASNFLYIPYDDYSVKLAIEAFNAVQDQALKSKYANRLEMLQNYKQDMQDVKSYVNANNGVTLNIDTFQALPFYKRYASYGDWSTYLGQIIKNIETKIKNGDTNFTDLKNKLNS